jgi:hypothetical protein
MTHFRITLPLLLAAASGCHSFGPLVKRESEMNCPTDIRRTVPWCWGQDAIFSCPCGPTDDFYGHKPTCWRCWPAPASQWRNAYCGYPTPCPTELPVSAVDGAIMVLPPTEVDVAEPVEPLESAPPAIEAAPSLEALPPTSSSPIEINQDNGRALRQQAIAGQRGMAPPRRALPAIFRPEPTAVVQQAVDVSPPDAGDAVQPAGGPGDALADDETATPWTNEAGVSGEGTSLQVVELPPIDDQPDEVPPSHPFLRAVERALGAKTH